MTAHNSEAQTDALHPLQKEERQFHDEVLRCLDILSRKIEGCRSVADRSGRDKILSMMVAFQSRVKHIAESIGSEIERKYRLDPVKDKDMARISEIDRAIKSIIQECGADLSAFSCSTAEELADFNEKVNAHIREFEKLYEERKKILRLYRIYG